MKHRYKANDIIIHNGDRGFIIKTVENGYLVRWLEDKLSKLDEDYPIDYIEWNSDLDKEYMLKEEFHNDLNDLLKE